MMQFQLSDEHEMIQKMVRDFAKNEVEPTAKRAGRGRNV